MADYIERKAAIKAFEYGDPDVVEEYDSWDCGCEFGFSHTNIRTILQSVPAVDVAPVVHGCWKRTIDGHWECSNCGAHENSHTAIKGYYCWRCGTKMDLEN